MCCGGMILDSVKDEAGWTEAKKHIRKLITKDMLGAAKNKLPAYLFLTKEDGELWGYCTGCGRKMKLAHDAKTLEHDYRHNHNVTCPKCGGNVTCKDAWRGRSRLIDKMVMIYYKKSAVTDRAIVGIEALYERDYSGDYTKTETTATIEDVYIFEHGKPGVRFKNAGWGTSAVTMERCRNCTTHKISNPYGYGYLYELVEDTHSLLETIGKTTFRRTGIAKEIACGNINPYEHCMFSVEVLNLISKYPCCEYIIKMGAGKLIEEAATVTLGKAVNWRGNSAEKVLKLTKKQLAEIKKTKTHLYRNLLESMQTLGEDFALEDVKWIADGWRAQELKDLAEKAEEPMRKIYTYLRKQNEKRGHVKYGALRDLRDYWAECKTLKMDPSDDTIRWPKCLAKAHTETSKRIKYIEDKKHDEQIQRNLAELKAYFLENEDYIIRPAATTQEIINEGNALCHCVGGYAKSYANGNTIICFIRTKDNPNMPFYTVEFNTKGTLIQCRGLKNKGYGEDIKAFLGLVQKQIEQSKARKAAW